MCDSVRLLYLLTDQQAGNRSIGKCSCRFCKLLRVHILRYYGPYLEVEWSRSTPDQELESYESILSMSLNTSPSQRARAVGLGSQPHTDPTHQHAARSGPRTSA